MKFCAAHSPPPDLDQANNESGRRRGSLVDHDWPPLPGPLLDSRVRQGHWEGELSSSAYLRLNRAGTVGFGAVGRRPLGARASRPQCIPGTLAAPRNTRKLMGVIFANNVRSILIYT